MQSTPAPARQPHASCFGSIGFLMLWLLSGCGLAMDNEDRLNRGEEAFADGEYRAAVIDAKNILLEEPDNVAARLLLGRASVELGNGVSAEREFRKALELGVGIKDVIADLGRALLLQRKFDDVIAEMIPELADADTDRLAVMRLRGDALIGLQQPVSAREIYTAVLASDSDDIAAQLGVVNSYIAEQNFLQARDTLDHVLTFDDGYIDAWLTSGWLGLRTQNAQRAVSDFERVAKLAKEHGDEAREMQALAGLADALPAQGKPNEVRLVLARMGEIAPDDLRTLLVSARLAISDTDWHKAQQNLQQILRRKPDFRPAQMLLGIVHKESGNLGQAEMYLSAVVAATPDNAIARRFLAETRLELNKAEEARKVLDPLVTGPTADVRSLLMAAGASLNSGDFDDATKLLQRSVLADPGNIELQIQLAWIQLRSGNSDDAQVVLEAIPAGSSQFERDSLLALTQMAQGKSAEALENARALLTRWPGRPDAHSLVGSIEMSNGDYMAARKSFSASSELAPADIQPIRYLAQLDELENAPESARNRYQLILELQPKDTRSMVALAKLSAQSEDHEKTREWLEKARESDAAAVAPRALLGSLYLAFREFSAAEQMVEEALDLDPENAKLHAMLGHAQFNQEDFRSAELSFGRALELDPNDRSHRLNLAKTQAKRGNKATAQVTLDDSIDRTLQHMPSAVLLAALKANAGDLDGAARIARRLRELFPDDAVPHVLEAELHVRSGDLIAASTAIDRALDISNTQRYAIRAYQIRSGSGLADPVEPLINYLQERPFDNNMRVYLAQAYQNLQEIGKAKAQYERVLSNEPDNFIAANNLAWNYFTSGDSRAEELARRAYEIQPDNGAVVDTLGWILVKKGAMQDGIAMLRIAADLSSGRSEIRFHLAASLATDGQTEEARSILQEILASDDEFSSRHEAESLLSTL